MSKILPDRLLDSALKRDPPFPAGRYPLNNFEYQNFLQRNMSSDIRLENLQFNKVVQPVVDLTNYSHRRNIFSMTSSGSGNGWQDLALTWQDKASNCFVVERLNIHDVTNIDLSKLAVHVFDEKDSTTVRYELDSRTPSTNDWFFTFNPPIVLRGGEYFQAYFENDAGADSWHCQQIYWKYRL